MNNSTLIKLLTYLGTLPFFLAIFISFTKQDFLGVNASQWFLTYGLVILSFMAGTLWGQVINESLGVWFIALASNVITLAAWLAFLLANSSISLVVIALGFIALYLLEVSFMKQIKRPAYYIGLRLRVTVLVVLAHGVMWLLL
jgi:hypothetical protein